MFCPKCGTTLTDNATFCAKCGTKLKIPETTPINTPDKTLVMPTEPVSEPEAYISAAFKYDTDRNDNGQYESVKTSPSSKKRPKFKLKKWQIGLIMGGSCLIITAIVIAVIWFSITTRQNDETRARSDIENSWVCSEGVVSSDYCKQNQYQIIDYEVINVVNNPDNSNKKRVDYKATIENNNFRSEIDGNVSYNKSDIAKVNADNLSTTPLKGVDFLYKTENEAKTKNEGEYTAGGAKSTNNNNNKDNYGNTSAASIMAYTSYTTFTTYCTAAPLNNESGKYICPAVANRIIERWFVKDKANVKQSFEFDSKKGWSTTGKETVEDKTVEYKLDGVEMVSASTSPEAGSHTIIFNNVDSDGNASANYSVYYNQNKQNTSTTAYNTINLRGTAVGKISHTYGETWFKFELKDSGQGVAFIGDDTTYKGSTTYYSSAAGDPREDYCFQCSIRTSSPLYTYTDSKGQTRQDSTKFERDYLLFKKNDS